MNKYINIYKLKRLVCENKRCADCSFGSNDDSSECKFYHLFFDIINDNKNIIEIIKCKYCKFYRHSNSRCILHHNLYV